MRRDERSAPPRVLLGEMTLLRTGVSTLHGPAVVCECVREKISFRAYRTIYNAASRQSRRTGGEERYELGKEVDEDYAIVSVRHDGFENGRSCVEEMLPRRCTRGEGSSEECGARESEAEHFGVQNRSKLLPTRISFRSFSSADSRTLCVQLCDVAPIRALSSLHRRSHRFTLSARFRVFPREICPKVNCRRLGWRSRERSGE